MIFVILFSGTLLAQERARKYGQPFDKYNAMRVAFITERLDLTPEEAEKFWPVYNEYQEKKQAVRQEKEQNNRYFVTNEQQIDEKEAAEVLDRYIELEKKDDQIDLDYHRKFKAVLSSKKIIKLYLSEHHFKSFLLRQIRNGDHRGVPREGDDF